MTLRTLLADELDEAAALLRAGAVVGIPTDTVYGLASLVALDDAVTALFVAKGRPSSVPVAVLCASATEAASLATVWPQAAARLAARFWPGPLTVVVAADEEVSARLGATGTVGVRVPADPVCLSLLERTGALAVTSANLHGTPPATTAAEVAAVFSSTAVAAVLDAGARDAEVSTVVDVTGTEPVVRRVGGLAAREVLVVARGA